MKKNRVYTVNSLLARISGNYKFWLIALPAVTMLAQAPAVYAHAETITVVQQNNATVRGSVKDATGESLIGVSVTVKGKSVCLSIALHTEHGNSAQGNVSLFHLV
jgi:hypothetical protein